MKKVSIITILDNTNYGTYLQALALGMVIQRLGYEVTYIRYVRECTTPQYKLKLVKADSYIRYLYLKFLRIPQVENLKKKDVAFLKKFVKVSPNYYSLEEIKQNLPKSDIYMTGSDQVWNSVYNKGIDKCMFLDFVPDGAKRVAYAASIGMESIPEQEKVETVRLLKRYSQITVREQQTVSLLNKLGIESKVVLDPTLLLNGEEWGKIAQTQPMELNEPFLLVYSVEGKHEAALMEQYAIAIAKERGLKIYEITYLHSMKKLRFADKHFCLATPDVFLNLMSKASFVVVSSFHGTAFSINMNKQFLTIMPGRFNSRVENILNITGLHDRLVTDASFSATSLREIDYGVVNEILSKERDASFAILEDLLKTEE